MNNTVCKYGNCKMAVPLQVSVVNPSLCAVYSQNWQIPNPAVTQRNCFPSSGKSLNKDWTRGIARVRHTPVQHANRKNGRAKSAVSLRSASADFLAETDDDEISDTMKEFKLTLQLFKRLTQQVHDVNQCMNQQRIYSFKHHMNNEGIASPALRRSQLAAAMSKREIPATEAPYEPCNDLGPACTYLTRPCSRQDRTTHSPSPMSRPSSSAAPSRSSSPSPNVRPSSRSSAKRTAEKAAELKKLEEELTKADAEAREAWEESDPHYEELFVAEELSLEDLEFRFHDPYPDTWVDEVVEDACFRGTKKTDPFMLRLSEFETLEEETVLWEKYREEKARQIAEAAKGSLHYKNARQQSGVSHINSRTQSAKISAPHLYRAKTGVNRLKRSSSAGKGSASNAAISASDEGSDSVQTFRNSGYKMGISFIPGSLYPEARPQKTSSKNAENVSKNVRSASPSAHVQKSPSPKPPSCEACYSKTTAGQKPAGASPRPIALSAHALRSQYELKASECYDIVELARTFDPPCKAQFVKAKAKSRASSADNALIKGITPGKSYFSQRRVSLTRLVPDESMSVRGIGAQNAATRPSTGRCKSAKKGLKRR